MNKRTPGHVCQERTPTDVDDGTGPRWELASPRTESDVSFEIAACYVPVKTNLALDRAEMQVLASLRAYRDDIIAAEQRFGADRRAIAGAIAWEMLENVQSGSVVSSGFAKIHNWNLNRQKMKKGALQGAQTGAGAGRGAGAGGIIGGAAIGTIIGAAIGGIEFETLAKEVEDAGYLPQRGFFERSSILAVPEQSILYLGAIMAAIADVALARGFEDLHFNPVILTNVYQQHTLQSWDAFLQTKPPGSDFKPGNAMAFWVAAKTDFLIDAVGEPAPLSVLPPVPGYIPK